MESDNINFFGQTNFRNVKKRFGIKIDDRRRHMYVIGKTGMGKTAMMQNMAVQDIQAGRGVAFVDPHGESAEALLDYVPSSRINDVVYFNPADLDFPISFNVMESVAYEFRHLVASGLMGVFKKIWPDVWSARMEYILNNSILALLEYPGATLLGVNRMLADAEYRQKVVDKVQDPVIKAFWTTEFARYTQRYETEATAAIQNKVGQFISAPLIRNIIGQVQSTIDMRKIMDEEKIFIMNLSKGRIGEDNSTLIGALLITKLQLAAMSRVDIPEAERKDFYLYVDEFQNFATGSFASILSEARKYRLALIMGHQYIAQLEEEVADAVFGNVGTIVSFRVGAEDAEFLEKEFSPEFMATDIVNLGKYNIYLKLLIDGLAGRPFSAETIAPMKPLEESNREKIIRASQERYSTPRQEVEEKIASWLGVGNIPMPIAPAGQQQQLFDARCAMCGKDTKVVFQPDGKRPVYCKPCRHKLEKKKEEEAGGQVKNQPRDTRPVNPEPAQKISFLEAQRREPVYLSPSNKEKMQRGRERDLSGLRSVLKEAIPQQPKPETKQNNSETPQKQTNDQNNS